MSKRIKTNTGNVYQYSKRGCKCKRGGCKSRGRGRKIIRRIKKKPKTSKNVKNTSNLFSRRMKNYRTTRGRMRRAR